MQELDHRVENLADILNRKEINSAVSGRSDEELKGTMQRVDSLESRVHIIF